MHSEIEFKVKHLMITTVTGYFKSFQVEAETEDDNFTSANSVVFTADVDSISTQNEQRDTHLKSADLTPKTTARSALSATAMRTWAARIINCTGT